MIVHGLYTPEDEMELQCRIAKIHAQYVLRYVENLNCPMWQKLQLIDAVAGTCRQHT